MGVVTIKYYVVHNGRGFWVPTPKMKKKGFEGVPCGPDGPAAWAIADRWNIRWQAARRGIELPPEVEPPEPIENWPENSLGDVFRRFRETDTWKRKPPRTKEDWNRGWRWIREALGELTPTEIEFEIVDKWYARLIGYIDEHGREIPPVTTIREAFGAMKTFRALWQVAAAFKLCNKDQDPSKAIRRKTPARREEIWIEGEAVRGVKGAWRADYRGLACIAAVMWDTGFSPVDARRLTSENRVQIGDAWGFSLRRGKTGRPALGTLSKRTRGLCEAYWRELGVEIAPGAPLFRNRSGTAYSKDTLGDDFRAVRLVVFGAAEVRKLSDMRRSGSVEALAGGGDLGAIGNKMGNDLERNKELQRVYLPLAPAVVEMADAARLRGRTKMRTGGGQKLK